MQIHVRFPPSPTGFLHIGNVRVALVNYLFAKKYGGDIILRFDDTDSERVKDEYKTQMLEDLQWLNISFDASFSQMERKALHDDALNKLLASGRVYECFETPEELEIKRKVLLSRRMPPIYDRESLNPAKKAEFIAQGRKPYYRFLIEHKEIAWDDIIQGNISFHGKNLSDPVISRTDGNYMYTFCSVVDDFLMNISHIIRGADHITNNAIQMQIFEALSSVYNKNHMPQFAHLPLFQASTGKISKRVGGHSIKELRESGAQSLAIKNAILKIGLSDFDDILRTESELIETFDLNRYNKAQTIFDPHLIWTLNAKCIASSTYNEAKNQIDPDVSELFFNDFKNNVTCYGDINAWLGIFKTKADYLSLLESDDQKFGSQVMDIIKNSKNQPWADVLNQIKAIDPARKGKTLFIPIRMLITGRHDGPDLAIIWKYLQIYG